MLKVGRDVIVTKKFSFHHLHVAITTTFDCRPATGMLDPTIEASQPFHLHNLALRQLAGDLRLQVGSLPDAQLIEQGAQLEAALGWLRFLSVVRRSRTRLCIAPYSR